MPSRAHIPWRRRWSQAVTAAASAGSLVLAACQDTLPSGPHREAPHGAYLVSAITCNYTRGQVAPSCGEDAHATSATLAQALEKIRVAMARHPVSAPRGVSATDVLLGQQGVNVFLSITGVTYSNQVFSFNTTVQNRTTEPFGTADGRTPASDSIRVFFQQSPVVTAGSGAITIANADGVGTFTHANEPYYWYQALLPSNATSAPPKLWQFNIPTAVTAFSFSVYVYGQVPDTSAAALAIPPHKFTTLAVGQAHTCAVRPTNHNYCWGFNDYGAIGVGESAPVTVPTGTLSTPSGAVLTAASAGSEFSCGVGTDQMAYCWGDNLSGELGDGTTTDRGEPAAVTGGLAFSSVVTGNEFACGLSSGTAFCWGDNYVGQLGDNSTTAHMVPTAVNGSTHFVALTAGAFHACGLTSGGSIYCWGDNSAGEIGNGTTTNALVPTLVSTGGPYTAVSAGNAFTCALSGSGAALCWGANVFGGLGNNTTVGSSTPGAVSGGHAFSSIASGGFHSCAISTGGPTFCWGSNESGQLGDGTQTDRLVPTQVSTGPYTLTVIGTGFRHSCGLTAGGATYCWGNNDAGQLGDGTTTTRTAPTAVLLP